MYTFYTLYFFGSEFMFLIDKIDSDMSLSHANFYLHFLAYII